jgi:hypothetical protein
MNFTLINLYTPTYIYHSERRQEDSDRRKLRVSKEEGITLIVIPYWWKYSEAVVRFKLATERPDLLTLRAKDKLVNLPTQPNVQQDKPVIYAPVAARMLT